ncbi:MAG: copper-containing nitrite reductase [Myxococcales bacterium]
MTRLPSAALRLFIPLTLVQFAAIAGADELPPEWTLAGQAKTCGGGPIERTFNLTAQERIVPVGMGFRADIMGFAGAGNPAVLETCQGDTVTIVLKNGGKMAHGLDTHAFFISPGRFGPVDSGGTLTLSGPVTVPGTFMFHCASGPTTDVHIKSGMFGAMIVYPRAPLRPAVELALLQGGFWGEPSSDGVIEADTTRIMHNDPFTLAFNGRLEHEMVHAHPHDLVRVYMVNAGPGVSSVHVMGTMLDRFYDSGNPHDATSEVQTGMVPAGGGATFEFRLPEKGMYMLVDHDNLRFLPFGMAISIMAE